MTLLDQYGRTFGLLGGLLGTVADRAAAGEYFNFDVLGVLPDPDPVLRKLGNEARALADLEADDQVTALTLARKNRVLNRRGYWFKPGGLKDASPTEAGKNLCDRLVKDLERLTLREVISGILTAPFHGLAVLEITWRPEAGWWHIDGLELKPPYWFGFNRHNELVFKGEGWREARALPEGKFILARHCPTYENPYGLRLLSRCLWPVAFKKGGLQFYTRFLEKFGAPWAVAYAPSQASAAEMDRMAQNLSRMVREATAVLPYGAKLELAAAAGGQGEHHEGYLRRMDAAIAKVLVGNTLTAEVGDKGSYAAARAHQDRSEDFAQADMDLVVTAFNDLAWYYARLNAGPEEMAPVFEYEEPEDLTAAAELDAKLHGLGVRFSKKHFQNRYSLAEDEFTVLQGGGAEFAAADPAWPDDDAWSAMEEAVRKYAPRAAEAGEEFFSQVWKLADEAKDFEELERGLASLVGAETSPGDFVELLGELMAGAGLMGRFMEAEKRNGR